MNYADYFGYYYYLGLLFKVHLRGDELVAALSGVPVGYEIVLEPLGDETFRMKGGPVNGLPFTFARSEQGDVSGIQAGDLHVSRISTEQAAGMPTVGRFPAPPVEQTPEKQAAFAGLLSAALAGDGGWIDYNLPYPKHEFIQFVTDSEQIIFHGSNKLDIETFTPQRSSAELYDRSGRGNRLAVYGTHEGFWAMFFAVMDRERLRGSIRNGVSYFYNQQGEALTLFNFSINQEQLTERPFCEGALYFLPRSAFERLETMPGVIANEWASEQVMRPLAKLRVAPEDWPFLDRLEGHDDSMLIRTMEIGNAIQKAATRAELYGNTLTTWMPSGAISQADLDYYLEKQAVLMPAIEHTCTEADGEVKLVRANLPPAVRAQTAKSYEALLKPAG